MVPPSALYMEALDNVGVKPFLASTRCNMFSTVTGKLLDPAACVPEYWKNNMTSTVQFTKGISRAVEYHGSFGAIVELGPHPALKGPATEFLSTFNHGELRYFSSCSRGSPDLEALLESAGQMVNSGFPVNLVEVNSPQLGDLYRATVLTDLPSYCWDYTLSHWAETRVSRQVKMRRFARHPLLGARISGDNEFARTWRNIWRKKDLNWLEQMQVSIFLAEYGVLFSILTFNRTREMNSCLNLLSS